MDEFGWEFVIMSFFSNCRAIVSEIVTHPFSDSIALPSDAASASFGMTDNRSTVRQSRAASETRGDASGAGAEPRRSAETKSRYVSANFKMVFLVVAAITVLSGVASIVLAGWWLTPTQNEQNVFDSMGFAWKAGIGAILGLIGGKAS
jgi:hypothetical protein